MAFTVKFSEPADQQLTRIDNAWQFFNTSGIEVRSARSGSVSAVEERTQTGLLNKVFELRREQDRFKPPPSKSHKTRFTTKPYPREVTSNSNGSKAIQTGQASLQRCLTRLFNAIGKLNMRSTKVQRCDLSLRGLVKVACPLFIASPFALEFV